MFGVALAALGMLFALPSIAHAEPLECRDYVNHTSCPNNKSCSRCSGGICYEFCHPEGYPDFCRGVWVNGDIEFCPKDTSGECDQIPGDDPIGSPYATLPRCQCVPLKGGIDIPANGIDDDCDGLIDDEECDGLDNDNNGFIDDARGSCLARVLAVPFCWDNSDPLPFSEQAGTEMFDWVINAGVQTCFGQTGTNKGANKVDFQRAAALELGALCDALSVMESTNCHSVILSEVESAFVARVGNAKMAEYDTIAFLTNRDMCDGDYKGAQTGARAGGTILWAQTLQFGRTATSSAHLPGVLTHEMGHVLGLGEEYCSHAPGADNGDKSPVCAKDPNANVLGPPNYLSPQLGCDIDSCCGPFGPFEHNCFNGGFSFLSNGCCGNISDPQSGSRCVMSSTNAEGDYRGYCPLCRAWIKNPVDPQGTPPALRWNPFGIRGPGNPQGRVPMDCSFQHPGNQAVMPLRFDLFSDGRVKVRSYDVVFGRLGLAGAGPTGNYEIELTDEQGLFVSHTGGFRYSEHDFGASAATGHVYHSERLPLPQGFALPSTRKVKLRTFKDGVPASIITINGQPPFANAGPDRVLECQNAGFSEAVVDGRSSTDPDGDVISFYSWNGSGAVLATPESATTSAVFPLGTSEVSLTVSDGVYPSAPDVAVVTVVDTAPPAVSCAGDMRECGGLLTSVTTSCQAMDACDINAVPVSNAQSAYPLGTHVFNCASTDAHSNTRATSCEVRIIDTTLPTITPSAIASLTVCDADPQTVVIPRPQVSDICALNQVVLTGSVIAARGKTLVSPVALPADGSFLASTGAIIVRWQARDPSGNVATLDQTFTVTASATSSCCGAGQTVVNGTTGADLITRSGGSFCVLAVDGADLVNTGTGNDSLFGGSGPDTLNAGGGADRLFGGPGADLLNSGNGGVVEAHGGDDDDLLQAASSTSARLWGGKGNDNITGGAGDDFIASGPGRDLVNAGSGNDTVVLYAECEVESGKLLDGGGGQDTLVTPVPLSVLTSRGVLVRNFETIRVDTSQQYLSPCF